MRKVDPAGQRVADGTLIVAPKNSTEEVNKAFDALTTYLEGVYGRHESTPHLKLDLIMKALQEVVEKADFNGRGWLFLRELEDSFRYRMRDMPAEVLGPLLSYAEGTCSVDVNTAGEEEAMIRYPYLLAKLEQVIHIRLLPIPSLA